MPKSSPGGSSSSSVFTAAQSTKPSCRSAKTEPSSQRFSSLERERTDQAPRQHGGAHLILGQPLQLLLRVKHGCGRPCEGRLTGNCSGRVIACLGLAHSRTFTQTSLTGLHSCAGGSSPLPPQRRSHALLPLGLQLEAVRRAQLLRQGAQAVNVIRGAGERLDRLQAGRLQRLDVGVSHG